MHMASRNDQPHTRAIWHWFDHETNNYLDIVACIALTNVAYTRSSITKHIAPKIFYESIDTSQSKSCDNLANLFTISLTTSLFQKYILE